MKPETSLPLFEGVLLLRLEENKAEKRELILLGTDGMCLSSGPMTGRHADTMPMLHSTFIQIPALTIVPALGN